ncbi:MAG: lactate utilization protein LutB domain-containing protein [Pseudomonadales bacterium]
MCRARTDRTRPRQSYSGIRIRYPASTQDRPRQRAHEGRLDGDRARWLLRLWAFFAARPRLYHSLLSLATTVLGRLAGPGGSFRRLLGGKAWTESRNFPAPEGGSFLASLQREEFAPTPRNAPPR